MRPICCPECFGRDLLSLTTDLRKWECVDCETLFTEAIGLEAEKQRALRLPAPYHPERYAEKVAAAWAEGFLEAFPFL